MDPETHAKELRPYRVSALLACHNRKDFTLRCLESLAQQAGRGPAEGHAEKPEAAKFELQVFLVDDGSTDGTAEAAAKAWPGIHVIAGTGELFWCGGMRVAWQHAQAGDPDYYLLLNDDTTLEPDTIKCLLQLAPTPQSEVIAVAPIADPDTGEVVCGGHIGHEDAPRVPTGDPLDCDTMNANCALVPRAVWQKVGMFHDGFTHAMGDYDYGFEAKRRGVRVVQAGKVLGRSKPNDQAGTWQDASLPKHERLRLLWSSHKRGLPFREWNLYCRRNYGWIWPYRCISPALHVLFSLRMVACYYSAEVAVSAL